jgi:hypothetical protein
MRILLVALVAALVTPTTVSAQCAFDRPNGSTGYIASYTSSLVRAFVSCNNPGGNVPNSTTVGGTIPTCWPAEDFGQHAGLPSNGWNFSNGLSSSTGKVQIKRTSGGENPGGMEPTSRDTVVKVKLYRIARNSGGYASGTGSVQVNLRVTTQDYLGDDMTVIDFPFSMPITLSSYGTGSASKKVGDILRGLSQPRWSDCTSVEILSVTVLDPNGDLFAVSGVRF